MDPRDGRRYSSRLFIWGERVPFPVQIRGALPGHVIERGEYAIVPFRRSTGGTRAWGTQSLSIHDSAASMLHGRELGIAEGAPRGSCITATRPTAWRWTAGQWDEADQVVHRPGRPRPGRKVVTSPPVTRRYAGAHARAVFRKAIAARRAAIEVLIHEAWPPPRRRAYRSVSHASRLSNRTLYRH